MHLDPDFREFVESFIVHDVRFLVVGGYAVAAHGLPRATGDLDAWVWIDPLNAQRIVRALVDFGFGSLDLTEDDFNREDSVVQLGYPPYRIDIITSIDGVDFDDAWERRMPIDVDDCGANVVPVTPRGAARLRRVTRRSCTGCSARAARAGRPRRTRGASAARPNGRRCCTS